MKLALGQLLSLTIALGFAALLIFDAPFIATAAEAASASQVVYAPIFEPPVIGSAAGRIDFPLLFLELAFVAFIGGAIFYANGQKKKDD